jgi:hypothetical protein
VRGESNSGRRLHPAWQSPMISPARQKSPPDSMKIALACAVFLLGLNPAITHAQQVPINHPWDVSIWAAGATGEENTNSFTEAQISSPGILIGKMGTAEIGSGWRSATWNLQPIFSQLFCNWLLNAFTESVLIPSFCVGFRAGICEAQRLFLN